MVEGVLSLKVNHRPQRLQNLRLHKRRLLKPSTKPAIDEGKSGGNSHDRAMGGDMHDHPIWPCQVGSYKRPLYLMLTERTEIISILSTVLFTAVRLNATAWFGSGTSIAHYNGNFRHTLGFD